MYQVEKICGLRYNPISSNVFLLFKKETNTLLSGLTIVQETIHGSQKKI